MSKSQSVIVHASCVALGGKGVLLLGASGAAKSDLALRLIQVGAKLGGGRSHRAEHKEPCDFGLCTRQYRRPA